jgi:NAD(P)-dependent dehydrogenase (short-subunit alcohol dehydrogenase family)
MLAIAITTLFPRLYNNKGQAMKWISRIWMSLLIIGTVTLQAEQKVALISGGTGGIGRATIKTFEEKGWKVWAGYRPTRFEHPQDTTNVRWIPLDVTDDDMIKHSIHAILEEDGKIDALINNAGYGIIGLEEAISIEEAKKLFDVNFFGAFRLIQEVIPHMQSQHSGHIINISSTSGVRALPGLGLYASSKFALEGLSEALAVTLSPWNIQVAIVEPGAVKNDFTRHCMMQTVSSSHPAKNLSQNLANRLIAFGANGQDCEEIGRVILDVAETAQPNMRYQTSSKVQETVAKKFVDLSGNKLREEQMTLFKSLIYTE